MNNKKTLRVTFEGAAKEAVERMATDLEQGEKFVKISPSKLVGWIVQCFEKRYFARHKKEIAQENFNSRDYLKSLASNIGKEEKLEEVLKTALKKARQKSPKGNA